MFRVKFDRSLITIMQRHDFQRERTYYEVISHCIAEFSQSCEMFAKVMILTLIFILSLQSVLSCVRLVSINEQIFH